MEDQLNVWPYIRALIRNWVWIVGASMLAAIVVFTIITLLPATFSSSTLITIVNPRDVTLESLTLMDFEPQFKSVVNEDPLIRVYSDLAISDKIILDLYAQLDSQLEGVNSVEDLRRLLFANLGNDLTLLHLTVKHPDPEIAADIANKWADLFVPWANDLFKTQVGQQVQFFEEQLTQANADQKNVEDALTQFQSQNRLTIMDNALNESIQAQADYTAKIRQLDILSQDVQALRNQLASATSTDITLSDQVAITSLYLRVFDAEELSPLQLQITNDGLITNDNRQEQLALLDNLLMTIASKYEKTSDLLAGLEPEILLLQQQHQEVENEQNRLLQQQVVANETYTALSRRIVEERISAQNSAKGIQIVSQATVPHEPIANNRLQNSIVSGAVTFMGTIFIILAVEWWQQVGKKHVEANDE